MELVGLEQALPAAEAGAHIDLHLPAGPRQYSLIAPMCRDGAYCVAVKREAFSRGGSAWIHEAAQIGMELRVSAPRNHFRLLETADASLLLAGGIGITPIYAMYERLRVLGRRVTLHYWSRSPEHTLFLSELEGRDDVVLHFASDPGRQTAEEVAAAAAEGSEIYCCGPVRMIAACLAHAPKTSRVHVERFANENLEPPVQSVGAFSVELARSGRTITVEAGETVLQALLAAGVDVPYSCEEGVCGACETKLLRGAALHRDAVRSAQDHDRLGTFMICCSLSRAGPLVLDL